MTTYETLGLRPIINASARLTRLGGSLMPQEVQQAMQEAACNYVDMHELQRRVGERIAVLTHNQAAYVCAGTAAGLALATAACMCGNDRAAGAGLPAQPPARREIIIHAAQRIPYDSAAQISGASLRTIGNALQTFSWELEAAITERTAAVLYIAGAHLRRGALSLDETIALAHARGVPVIVDAAAQLPPVENLWHFTRDRGADLALFSGGKDLCGPQATGLIVGRTDLIECCRTHGAPHQRFGRPFKVSKEEMVGLLAAVERYLTLDHVARIARWETTVQWWVEALHGLPGIAAERAFPNEAGQPTPRLRLTFPPGSHSTAALFQAQLWDGEPAIAADTDHEAVYLTPDTLEPGEEQLVLERLRSLLEGC